MVINRHEGPSTDILKASSCRKMLKIFHRPKIFARLSDVGMGQTWENMEKWEKCASRKLF